MSSNMVSAEDQVKILNAYLDKLNTKETTNLLRRFLGMCTDQVKVNLLTKILCLREQPDQSMIMQISKSFEPAMDARMIKDQLVDLLKVDKPTAVKPEPDHDASEKKSVVNQAPEYRAEAFRMESLDLYAAVSGSTMLETAPEHVTKTAAKPKGAKPLATQANTSTKVSSKTTSATKPVVRASTPAVKQAPVVSTPAAKQRAKSSTPAIKPSNEAFTPQAKQSKKASVTKTTQAAEVSTPVPKARARKRASSAVTETAVGSASKKACANSDTDKDRHKLIQESRKLINDARKAGLHAEADQSLRGLLQRLK